VQVGPIGVGELVEQSVEIAAVHRGESSRTLGETAIGAVSRVDSHTNGDGAATLCGRAARAWSATNGGGASSVLGDVSSSRTRLRRERECTHGQWTKVDVASQGRRRRTW
jgi:hypothetical protein